MYGYFALAALAVGIKSPPFSKYAVEELRQEGEFARLHARIVAHSEEIAFMGGEKKELALLEQALKKTIDFKRSVSRCSFRQNVLDNWIVKYSSC